MSQENQGKEAGVECVTTLDALAVRSQKSGTMIFDILAALNRRVQKVIEKLY